MSHVSDTPGAPPGFFASSLCLWFPLTMCIGTAAFLAWGACNRATMSYLTYHPATRKIHGASHVWLSLGENARARLWMAQWFPLPGSTEYEGEKGWVVRKYSCGVTDPAVRFSSRGASGGAEVDFVSGISLPACHISWALPKLHTMPPSVITRV